MSAAALPVISPGQMMRLLEQAMRDGTWKQSPVGRDVQQYLRALRWEGKKPNTLVWCGVGLWREIRA